MFDVRVNPFENHLFIILKGKIELTEATSATEKIAKVAKSLVPGFTVITDIRELAPAAEDVRQLFLNAMQSMKNAGLGIEIRVVNTQNMITANQFQRTSRAAGYTAQEVASVPEAQKMLDQLVAA